MVIELTLQRIRDADKICDRRAGKQKRAAASPFGAGLRGQNRAKHLNPDNSTAKQLAPSTAGRRWQI